MDLLRYSSTEFQRILQLSESGLSDFIKRNADFLSIEKIEGQECESYLIRKNDFEKLMLVRVAELANIIEKDRKLRELSISGKTKTSATLRTDAESLIELLDKLGDEIKGMDGYIKSLSGRYVSALNQYLQEKQNNGKLQNEIEYLKARQEFLIKKVEGLKTLDVEREIPKVIH
ncbi:MAG: hypothetical protein HQM08_06795 [Candidatus Riflebacteria bacterium]|nr:hypothetical protein [Candidatus Riflebacteria bacterium]